MNSWREEWLRLAEWTEAMPKKQRRLIFLTTLGLIGVLFVPWPVAFQAHDTEQIVSHTLTALFQNRRVMTGRGFGHLADTRFLNSKTRVYYQSDLGLPHRVFMEYGLLRLPQGIKVAEEPGAVLVSFSYWDRQRECAAANIQFSYSRGGTAERYEIRVYRSLLLRYLVYVRARES